jgi:hypothetical protein
MCVARIDISWSSSGFRHLNKIKLGMRCSEAVNLRELVVPPSVDWPFNGWCDEAADARQQQ